MEKLERTVRSNIVIDSRMAAELVKTVMQFESTVYITLDNHKANAKSLLGVLVLEIAKGTVLTVSAEGSDSAEAVAALEQFLLFTPNTGDKA